MESKTMSKWNCIATQRPTLLEFPTEVVMAFIQIQYWCYNLLICFHILFSFGFFLIDFVRLFVCVFFFVLLHLAFLNPLQFSVYRLLSTVDCCSNAFQQNWYFPFFAFHVWSKYTPKKINSISSPSRCLIFNRCFTNSFRFTFSIVFSLNFFHIIRSNWSVVWIYNRKHPKSNSFLDST